MVKIKVNKNIILTILCGLLLFSIYSINLSNICTVWELPDEARYLGNAAYFAGIDWQSFSEVDNSYYGYGYSIVLIPLFWLCGDGISLVKCVIFINYIFILMTYFIQVYLLRQIFTKSKYETLLIGAIVANILPYLFTSANKAICEVFLSFNVWFISFFLFKYLKTKEIKFLCCLALSTVYIYMVHTRAIAVVVSVFLIIIICNRNKLYNLFLFTIFVVLILLAGLYIKSYLLNNFYIGDVNANSVSVGNTLSVSFIWERIKWLFDPGNVKEYIICSFCRLFYVLSASGLTIILGWKYVIKVIIETRKNIDANNIKLMMLLFWCLQFTIMFILCCISGAGVAEDFTYSFYGRYIEYVLSPLVAVGIVAYCNGGIIFRIYDFLVIILSGYISSLKIDYLLSNGIRKDTARISGFTYWIEKNDNYVDFILSLLLLLVCLYLVLFLVKRLNIEFIGVVFISLYLLLNGYECIELINNVNEGKFEEYQIVEYIEKNIDSQKIVFLNEGYGYKWDFARMQIFLYKIPVSIINSFDEIGNSGEDYLIVYSSVLEDNEKSKLINYEKIMETSKYTLLKNKR